jgi:hypothetical protein
MLGRTRPRHVYVSALAAFVALLGFEAVRMATGHDPALASARPAATATPLDTAPLDAGPSDAAPGPDFGGGEPPGGGGRQEDVPQPETRLS